MKSMGQIKVCFHLVLYLSLLPKQMWDQDARNELRRTKQRTSVLAHAQLPKPLGR
jgi:hypothetical protein